MEFRQLALLPFWRVNFQERVVGIACGVRLYDHTTYSPTLTTKCFLPYRQVTRNIRFQYAAALERTTSKFRTLAHHGSVLIVVTSPCTPQVRSECLRVLDLSLFHIVPKAVHLEDFVSLQNQVKN